VFVCMCMAVTEVEIRTCLHAGATTTEQVSERTGAGTGCGGCLETVELLVEGGSILHPGTEPRRGCRLPRSA
jgi:bacterioferritin-associated ferredoxin